MQKIGYILANFGGPRSRDEIALFMESLLTDRDVISTRLPRPIHHWLFKRIARRRAKRIEAEYQHMGGGSPIYAVTEELAQSLRPHLAGELITFHRYLPPTHAASLQAIEKLECDELIVFPLFPQFTYATTGSMARFFAKNLASSTCKKLRWVKSYPTHKAFVSLYQHHIHTFMQQQGHKAEETFLLFSAHGLPKRYVEAGDPYLKECRDSMQAILKNFAHTPALLAFQSRFGPEEWLQPYTEDVCKEIKRHALGCRHVLFVPLSFTSDHLETLVEVEQQYIPLITQAGFTASRLPAFNVLPQWIEAIPQILNDTSYCTNKMLIKY